MKRSTEGVALISFTLKIFSFFDQRQELQCWSSVYFEDAFSTKILPPIPAIEGSVKQDLSLFVQISISYFFWFLLYIFIYCLIPCWSMLISSWLFVEISIWTFGEKAPLRTTGQHMFKSICLYFYLYSYMYFYLKFYLCFYLKRPLIGQLCDTCSNAVVCISPRTLSSYCHCIDFSM